jgi:glucose/arabinose dehydrogenase
MRPGARNKSATISLVNKTHCFFAALIILFSVVSLNVLAMQAASDKTLESENQCDRFECVSPSVNDPNLHVELIYQSHIGFEPNQESPVSTMTFLNQDILLLSKNNGTVLRLINGTDGEYHPRPFLDVNVANKQERGLLGITVSKENMTIASDAKKTLRTYVFLFYTESERYDGSDICHVTFYCDLSTSPLGNRLYRYEFLDNSLQKPKLLLDLPATPAPGHNGGVVRVGPDNNVYVTVGDLVGLINDSSSTKAQNFKNGTDPDGRAGILRITQDGEKVDGIIGEGFPLDRYYAYGIRNSFGIDFDPVTGYLWDTENGPGYGDEINLVRPGFNSGWDVVQGIWRPVKPAHDDFIAGDKSLSPKDLVDFGGKGKYSTPEFIWINTVGPSGLKFLNSDKLGKQYENDLFVGSFNLGTIFHFDLNTNRTGLDLKGLLNDKIADSNMELNDNIFVRGLGAITDLEIGPDGYLYILSNSMNMTTISRIIKN